MQKDKKLIPLVCPVAKQAVRYISPDELLKLGSVQCDLCGGWHPIKPQSTK